MAAVMFLFMTGLPAIGNAESPSHAAPWKVFIFCFAMPHRSILEDPAGLQALAPSVVATMIFSYGDRGCSAHTGALRMLRAAEAADRGAETTKDMTAAADRASYVPDAHVKGDPDPGARAVAIWLAAVASALASD